MTPATRHSLLRAALVLLFGVAGALGVLAFQRWDGSGSIDEDLARLETKLGGTAAGGAATDDKWLPLVRDRIRNEWVFSRKPEDRYRQVRGVLGDRVFFASGDSATVGEEIDGAEIVAVGAESVDFRKDGEDITVPVAGSSGGGGRGGGGGSRSRRGGRS